MSAKLVNLELLTDFWNNLKNFITINGSPISSTNHSISIDTLEGISQDGHTAAYSTSTFNSTDFKTGFEKKEEELVISGGSGSSITQLRINPNNQTLETRKYISADTTWSDWKIYTPIEVGMLTLASGSAAAGGAWSPTATTSVYCQTITSNSWQGNPPTIRATSKIDFQPDVTSMAAMTSNKINMIYAANSNGNLQVYARTSATLAQSTFPAEIVIQCTVTEVK